MLRPPRELRLGPRWTVLAPVAVAHVWTMTWLAWMLAPAGLRNPDLAAWGLAGSLVWACAAALGVVVGGAALAAVPEARGPGGCRRALGWIGLGAGALAAGVLAATMLGAASGLLAATAGLGAPFYRTTGRFFPAVAVVGAGLWHALVMAVPDPGLSFAWPVVLVLTHVMVLAFLERAYGVGRPRPRPGSGWAVAIGWAFLALLLAGGMTARDTTLLPVTAPAGRWMWAGPAAAMVAFAAVAAAMLARAERTREAVRRLTDLGRWWLIVYHATWLLGAGLVWPAAAVLALLLFAVGGRWRRAAAEPEPGYRLP